jgi:hypothetical protein
MDRQINTKPVGAAEGCEQRCIRHTAFVAVVTYDNSYKPMDRQINTKPVGAAEGCEQRCIKHTAFVAVVTSDNSCRHALYLTSCRIRQP